MKIDRERFLTLVAALAGACATPGCSKAHLPPGDRRPGSEPIVIPVQPAQSLPRSATVDAPEPEPEPAPVASSGPVSSKGPNPYEGTPITAQACDPALNRKGSPPACMLTAPGPTCESFGDTKKECPTLNQLFKPRVAAAAIACLRRKSGTTEICEFNITGICAYEALGSACLDPSATAACNGVVATCGRIPGSKMTREACEAGVSAIADAKRQKFISCITESCRFETCLTYL